MLIEIYHDALVEKEEEVDKLTYELEISQESFKSTQMTLQESELQVD